MAYKSSYILHKPRVEDIHIFNTSLFSNKDRIILAPLQGLTEYEFRNAYTKIFPNSIDLAISPFISLTHGDMENSVRKYKDIIPENNKDIKLIPQVLGNDPKGILEVSNAIYKLGYRELNLNLGCSIKRITKKTRGSALLKEAGIIENILKEITNHSPCLISLKLRLGYESSEDIFRLIPIFNSYPIKSIIIHPRLGKNEFSSELDLDSFEKAYNLIKTTVVYNGEIRSLRDFNYLKNRFPNINNWMIGRGLLNDPNLASNIKGVNYVDNKERIFSLHKEILPSLKSLNKLKEYWTYLSYGYGLNSEDMKKILGSNSIQEIEDIIIKNKN